MKNHFVISAILLGACFFANSQNTLVLQPDGITGKDCEIFSLQPTTNYVSDLLRGNAWTWSGVSGLERGLFEFDLSSIPSGSVIDSAFLFLYSPTSPSSQFHSGSNASFLRRITSNWSETDVTWNNQPSTTNENQVALPTSTYPYQDYMHLDVSNLVTDMVDNPSISFGFMIILQVEQIRRRMTFCSSDYPDSDKRPKLIIHYKSEECITATLQPGSNTGKDCEIFNLEPNSNYVSDLLRGNAWTWSGTPGLERGLFEFDLSFIPVGSTIQTAFLDLYSSAPPNSQYHSGNNACFLKRITSEWSETSVTWNKQPTTTDINQVTLPTSNASYQDYLHIDVSSLVQDMINNPGKSYGFMILQQVEEIYRRMTFCSSDYPDASKHPKLNICYSPSNCSNSVVFQPDASGKDCEIFSLLPYVNYKSDLLRGNAWTFRGKPGIERGLLEFDLSSIPNNATISWARLSLFSPNPPNSQFHSGNNEAFILRIITPWIESTVTWNNQPKTTTANQVSLSASSTEYQDYLNIDVTALVKDMIDSPDYSFGFMLKLQNEIHYRRLSFCSSDYPDPSKHPKLEICYESDERSVHQDQEINNDIKIYPNPCEDLIYINMDENKDELNLQISDLFGRIIFENKIEKGSPIDMSKFPSAMYIFRIFGKDNRVISVNKIMKQ